MNSETNQKQVSIIAVVFILVAFAVGFLVRGFGQTQDPSFTPGGISNLDSLTLGDDLIVGKTTTLAGTTTQQEITYGSRFASSTLAFSKATPTTTPGGLGSLQNTGDPKICSRVELDVRTQLEGAMEFSVATSTTDGAFSQTAQVFLIASTTIATGTTDTLNSLDDAGGGIDAWVWARDEFILATFDSSGAGDNASSSDYSTAVGGLYVTCHTQ